MAQINYELQPRSYEIIRDRLGLIIADELLMQAAVSYEDLFLAPVYVQRSKPVQIEETPVVCVSVDKGAYDNHTVIDSDGEFTFFIDCYTTGSYSGLERGDISASKDAQRLAGVVEAIVANPIYKTLGFAPPFIMRSKVMGFEPAIIQRGEEANLSVVRLTVVVKAGQAELGSEPISTFTTQTQVLIYNTAEGYLYSGTGAPVPNPPACAPAFVVNSNGQFFQEISSGSGFELPNTPVTIKDQNGNDLGNGNVPSVSGGEIIVDPAQEAVTYAIKDTLNNILYSGSVNAPGNLDQTIADSTYLVEYENGTPIESGSILAEGFRLIQVPNPIVCAPATVENSNATYTATVVSGGTLVLPDITVTDSDGSTYTQPSVGSVTCTLSPDTSLEVNGTPEGTFAAGSTIEVNVTDGINPVTPNDVTVVGDVVTIEVPAAITPDRFNWIRNPDWITLPTISPSDNRFVGLFLVFENGYNFLTFTLTGTSINIDVDFGDGTTQNVLASTTLSHTYDYSTVSGAVSQYYDGRNYKQVIVDIQVNSGTLTAFNPNISTTINNTGCIQFGDINLAFPNLTTMSLSGANKRMFLLERLNILNHSVVAAASFSIDDLLSLRKLDFNFNTINSLAAKFLTIGNTDPFDISSTVITTLASAFSGNRQIQRIGNISCPNVTTWNQFAFNASSLVQVGNVSLPSSTVNTNVFSNCFALQKVGSISLPAATSLDGFFSTCKSLKEANFTDVSLVTNTSNMFVACSSLERVTLTGLRVGFTVAGCAMSAAALNDLFTSLGTASGSQTIIVTNNPGAATCDTTIATAKGFSVTI
jgi:TATA-box binding protein (TBP) (component of TFIID and TFIIIB)